MTRWLWRAPAWSAILAGWLTGALMLLASRPALDSAPPLVISMIFVLLSAISGGVAALLGRLTPAGWRRVLLTESLSGLGLAGGLMLTIAALLAAIGRPGLPAQSHVGAAACYFYLGLSAPGFVALRGLAWGYRYWEQLRRRHFTWALTDAHLKVIIGVGLAGLILGLVVTSRMEPDVFAGLEPGAIFSRLMIWIFTLIIVSVLFAFGSLLVFVPFSAIFSYWIARRMTRRLDKLSQATSALQNGDLDQRVVVEGEDEVALLQSHFNAMAANLQRSTQALQSERDKVAALLQNQRELTASISHELRTPISLIHGYVEALRQHWEQRPADDLRRELDIVARETQRLQIILNDLLGLSQAEAGRLSLNLASTDPGALLQRAVDTFAPLAWERQKVQVVAEIEAGLPPIQADALRLEQAIVNLLHNALRYTPPGGLVAASATRRERAVRLTVSDTGAGIPPEDMPHIWDKFYQSGDPQRRTPAGAGLGLALVKELSQAMHAQVGAHSSPDEGSTFWIEFPL